MKAFPRKKNDEVEDELLRMLQRDDQDQNAVVLQDGCQGQSTGPIMTPDKYFNVKIRMLNQKQQDIFDAVPSWSN